MALELNIPEGLHAHIPLQSSAEDDTVLPVLEDSTALSESQIIVA
jgi:hypothetical protein